MRSMYRVYLAMAVVCCCGVMAFAAGVPNTLNYQGTLTSGTGTPVTATKPMLFKMYTSAMGGNAFWTEQQSVNVKNGNFSVVFGSNATNTIPTAKFNGTTYIGVTVDPPASEMLPRQKLTSVAYALKSADDIPKGVIVMWSGAITQIPSGWALCDGTNGTPNLKNRFIVGAGGSYAVSTSNSASTSISTGESGKHSHTGNTGNTMITIDQMPSHDHNFGTDDQIDRWFTRVGTFEYDATSTLKGTGAILLTTKTGGGQPHSHTIQEELTHNHMYDNRPPYYALAFIMKL